MHFRALQHQPPLSRVACNNIPRGGMSTRNWLTWSQIVLGLATVGFGIVVLAIRILALRRWTTVEGRVLESVVVDTAGEFSARVTIRWNFNGSDYSRTFDDWGTDARRASHDLIVARYPKDGPAPILCNPANPSKAFLEAGHTLSFLMAPGGLILAGLAITAVGYLLLR
jgi:hypothetical protein